MRLRLRFQARVELCRDVLESNLWQHNGCEMDVNVGRLLSPASTASNSISPPKLQRRRINHQPTANSQLASICREASIGSEVVQ